MPRRASRVPALLTAVMAALLPLSSTARAQIPDEFSNLKLLDREITKPELVEVMREWALGLGVRCSFCHVGPDNLETMDFASDEKATKRTARRMLEMLRAINGELLADLPLEKDGRDRQRVSCYTCHRGQERPPSPLPDLLADTVQRAGPAAAIDEYRRLRSEHLEAGRYDFREETLIRLARDLVQAGDLEGGLAILDGAKEFFGESPSLYVSEGMIKRGRQDLDGARASFEEALSRDPDFEPARRALERLETMTTGSEPENKPESEPESKM